VPTFPEITPYSLTAPMHGAQKGTIGKPQTFEKFLISPPGPQSDSEGTYLDLNIEAPLRAHRRCPISTLSDANCFCQPLSFHIIFSVYRTPVSLRHVDEYINCHFLLWHYVLGHYVRQFTTECFRFLVMRALVNSIQNGSQIDFWKKSSRISPSYDLTLHELFKSPVFSRSCTQKVWNMAG
jgi:hypothetical protein